jgi:hypothetical protein
MQRFDVDITFAIPPVKMAIYQVSLMEFGYLIQ